MCSSALTTMQYWTLPSKNVYSLLLNKTTKDIYRKLSSKLSTLHVPKITKK